MQSIWRKIKNIEDSPEWQSWALSHRGRLTLLAIGTLAFALIESAGLPVALPALALILYLPHRREAILAISAVAANLIILPARMDLLFERFDPGLAIFQSYPQVPLAIVSLAAVFAIIWIGNLVARLSDENFFKRHAFALVVSGILGLAILISPLEYHTSYALDALALLLLGMTYYLLYFAYDCRSGDYPERATGWRRLAYYAPFWNYVSSPVPRGEFSLKSQSAQDQSQIARLRLAALKLFVWALVAQVMYDLVDALAYGRPAMYLSWLPRIVPLISAPDAIEEISRGGHFSFLQSWVVIFGEFFYQLLSRMAIGHLIVATLWTCGYNARLLIDRPVGSVTFLEFFNRYSYYYKELLLNIFYYPVYFGRLGSKLKNSPRLRVFVSVLASVGLGNMLVRWIIHLDFSLRHGVTNAIWHYRSHILYCSLLSLAVALSMSDGTSGSNSAQWSRPRRIFAMIGVTVFYAYIHIFDESFSGSQPGRNFILALSALGIHR